MRIDQHHPADRIHSGAARGAEATDSQTGSLRSRESRWADLVEVSQEASDLLALRRLALAAPEVREELVAAVQAKLASGTYWVPSDVLAERILEEAWVLSPAG